MGINTDLFPGIGGIYSHSLRYIYPNGLWTLELLKTRTCITQQKLTNYKRCKSYSDDIFVKPTFYAAAKSQYEHYFDHQRFVGVLK